MLFRTTVIASAALALLASMAEAHSWADCVDWRFNNPDKPGYKESDGKCFGWGRQYYVNRKVPFAGRDSVSPIRHFQQYHDSKQNANPCSNGHNGAESGSIETRQNPISKAYGGKDFGVMATATAGQTMCIRWPAKNHAVKSEKENFVFINMPKVVLDKDPDQNGFTKANIAKIPYKNCESAANEDIRPCGGCFTVPPELATGTYVVQWRWELNKGEFYTSCWDVGVTGTSTNTTAPGATTTLGGSTSVFAELAED
ncbi:hypothetical protein BC939DRAFT_457191 [Gamsiella multidivaricata]|uniref:uncharacterized protein n=1 Tax=Gamsiella multidivaricata TaxID=101098 RepID=UPI00221EEAFB|nr:uncharacterized protein BC939DRAFT_457191 [Gamsiella multidivaricata]KAI7820620.1 hypothetical protein BC939DRAFT_457191 [Gamsiella multidivaricata]